jgi:hypothetical protein
VPAERVRRPLAWLFAPPDEDWDGEADHPDPPVEDPYVRLARASSALNAAQNEWAQAVAMLAARRLER